MRPWAVANSRRRKGGVARLYTALRDSARTDFRSQLARDPDLTLTFSYEGSRRNL